MTRNLNELHPAPNSEIVADMEMQPEQYTVISLGSAYGRETLEDAAHARARIVMAFGHSCTRDELNALAIDAIAALHAFLDNKHQLRLDYVPGTGDGPTPADTALEEFADATPPQQPHQLFALDTEGHPYTARCCCPHSKDHSEMDNADV